METNPGVDLRQNFWYSGRITKVTNLVIRKNNLVTHNFVHFVGLYVNENVKVVTYNSQSIYLLSMLCVGNRFDFASELTNWCSV